MYSLLKTSLLLLAASYLFEAAPNSPNTADEHPTAPLPGIMTFQVQQIDMPNEKFRNAVLRSPAGICHPKHVDEEAKKFSVDWTKCGVVVAADLEHITIDIQNDLIDPVHTVKLSKEEFGKFFAGGDAQIMIKPVHGKPTGFFDYKITYLNGLQGTMKFIFDHHELGDDVQFESVRVQNGYFKRYENCEITWNDTNRSEFSVNWAKCVPNLNLDVFQYNVKIWFMFKIDGKINVREIHFLNYPKTFLKYLYSGGEAKIVIHADKKKQPTIKYVKYPNGEAVPLPGIMTFQVQIDMQNEKYRSAYLNKPGGACYPIFVNQEAKKFSVDWTHCGVVDAADLEHITIIINNDLNPRPEGHVDPVHTVKLPKEEYRKFFAGGDAQIVIKPAHGKPTGLIEYDYKITYLNGLPGTMKFSVDHQELGDDVQFESVKVEKGNYTGFRECEITWTDTNPSEFSVNWAKCVPDLDAFQYNVKIWFMFKTDGKINVREIHFLNYSKNFLKYLYSGGEAKIVIHKDIKEQPTIKYVRRPNGDAVPLPAIMTFHVQIDILNEKFRSAYLNKPGGACYPIFVNQEAKKFSVDWTQCDVVEAADLKHISINIQNDLDPKPEGYFDPIHGVVLPMQDLGKFFAGGDAKIVIKREHGKIACDFDVIYLNGPSKSGASASSSGSRVEVGSGLE